MRTDSITSFCRRMRTVGVGIGAGLFLLTVAAFVRPPLLPAIGRDLGMTAIGLGLLGSVFAAGRLAADFPAGRMTDRVRPGPMMSISAMLVAAGSVVLAIAPNPLVAHAAMLLLGIGSTFTLTTAMAYFAQAPRIRRGVSVSAFAAWLLAGQSFGPTLGGSLGGVYGWRQAVAIAGLIAIGVAVAFLFSKAPFAPASSHEPAGKTGTAHPVRSHVLGLIYLLPAVQFALGGALLQTLIPIAADSELGIGPGTVGVALGLGGVSRFVAALVTGQISDRVSRKRALVPGQILQTAGIAVFMLWSDPVAWLVSIVLVTLGSAGVNVGVTILADLSEGSGLGKRLAAFRFTGDSALVVAPLLSGWLYQVAGRAVATVPLLLLSAVVTFGVWIFVPETGRWAAAAP
jgi:MFS family permease